MTRPLTDREALIAALAEDAQSSAGGKEPEPEELLAYLKGQLSPDDEERVGRQLIADPAAARALLDLADFEAAGAAAGTQLSELAVHAGWHDLAGRLPAKAPSFRRLQPLLSAVAATLLVTTVGLGFRVLRLQSELHSPVANVKSLVLVSDSRASGEEVRELEPEAPLLLVLEPAERCTDYSAELQGPRPEDRRPIEGLKRNEEGRLTLQLQRVEPGLYRLRLFGCEPRRELEAHHFRIIQPHGG